MGLTFDRTFSARHGEAVIVAPGIRRVTAPNPGPFTFQGTNTYLIGGQELAVIDPGPAEPRHIDALVAAIGGAEVRHILVSHTHRDHSPGARLLQARTGAPTLAEGPHRPSRPPNPGEATRLDAAADPEFTPDIRLTDGECVEGRGYRLQAITTPGHTANHLSFALIGRDILFSGDHVMGWATTAIAPPDGSMGAYMDSLRRLMWRAERLYLPAHGGAIADAHNYMRGLHAHRRMRESDILAGLAHGDRTVAQLVARVYATLDPQLLPAAALSALAHLEDLVERRMVVVEGEVTANAAYRLAPSGRAAPATGIDPDASGAG